MAVLKQRRNYFETEQGKSIVRTLESMTFNDLYNTNSTYDPNSERYPDNLKPFVDKHIDYLNSHPQMDPLIYLANVKMATRLRR